MRENIKGYSLIELLVSITIILVLTGIGVTSFSGLTKTKKVITVKNEISTLIRLSRNLAITRQMPDSSLGLDYVKFAISGRNLVVSAINNNGTSIPFFTKSIDNDMNGVGVTVTSNLATFGFERGTGRLVNSAGAFINGPLIITLKYGVTDTITINDLGIINEE